MATIKSIEEKAKAYDKAIEGIQKYVKDDYGCIRLRPEDIFPELKESEDKRMIQYFKDLAPFDKADELYEKYGFSHKDAIAWLEKRGEQKSSWSEEDKAVLDALIRRLEGDNIYVSPHLAVKCLKSLKDRVQPQSTWKPSDKQMKQLGWIAEQNKDNMIGKELMTLYQDLKK